MTYFLIIFYRLKKYVQYLRPLGQIDGIDYDTRLFSWLTTLGGGISSGVLCVIFHNPKTFKTLNNVMKFERKEHLPWKSLNCIHYFTKQLSYENQVLFH